MKTTISMHSLRELDRVEDRIRQHRQVDKRAVLVVEGPDDLLLLKNHLPGEVIFPADGKKNVISATAALRGWSVAGVRGLVDADFDGVPADDWILSYDARDLEGMLIDLGVLQVVLEHRGSAQKIRAAGGIDSVIDMLVNTALAVARIRAANEKHKWGLRFDEVELTSKADRRTLVLDVERYCAALIGKSDTTTKVSVVLAESSAQLEDERGPRGRDVVSLAGLALRHLIGTLPSATCDEVGLSSQLRSSAALIVERSAWLAALRVEIGRAEGEIAA